MASTMWVNRAHPLDKDRTAIIAHFPDDGDVEYIMSRVKELSGTGYSVYRDFPIEVRQKRALLAAVREEVGRVVGWRRMPLVFDHLTISGCRFTWENGELKAGATVGAEKLHQLFKHDFSEFLNMLKENGPPKRHFEANSRHQQKNGRLTARQGDAETRGAASVTSAREDSSAVTTQPLDTAASGTPEPTATAGGSV